MARAERFRFSHARKIEMVDRFTSDAERAGMILQSAQSPGGRYVSTNGKRLLNFGSCSYMALEHLPELKDAARAALDEYGTQFHFSRAYMQCPLYSELEALLTRIAGRSVLVAQSTSLAHMAALPVLVGETDTIIIDQFAHASLHSALHLLPHVPIQILRHNRMDQLDTQLTSLRDRPGHVWYVADGLYSMLGDFAPFDELKQLLDKHPKLRLYIDDAHSTSWLGEHGRGAALEHFVRDERVVVALSLNKAFSAAGGALAVPDGELARRIRRCGGPMLFSGPLQPPMLGAAVGSARLHLSPELPELQAQVQARIAACSAALDQQHEHIELATTQRSTIFQLQCDSPRIATAVARAMKERGFYCCLCVFPAVPMNKPGLRFTMCRHNELTDIAAFISALRESVQLANQQARTDG